MPTTTETRVNDLIINKMSKAQFDALQEKSPTELYIVEGDSNAIYAEQITALPTAAEGNLGKVYQYIGATDANYTNGYFYKCTETLSFVGPAEDATEGEPGESMVFALDSDAFAAYLQTKSIVLVGQTTFYLLEEADAETGDSIYALQDADYVTIEEFTSLADMESTTGITWGGQEDFTGDFPYSAENATGFIVGPTYAWNQIEVQPAGSSLPDQTGQAGKFLTTDGTDASWSDKPLVNTATNTDGLTILGTPNNKTCAINIGALSEASTVQSLAIGYNAKSFGLSHCSSMAVGPNAKTNGNAYYPCAIGLGAQVNGSYSLAIGLNARCDGSYAIQLGNGTNNDNRTLKVGLGNIYSGFTNYELLSGDGTIPEARLADTTNAQQGDVLTLDSNGNAVWQASSGGVPTLTWYTISTAGTTLTIADTSSAQLVKIYKNGLLLQPTEDYTISGTTLTTVSAMVVGDKITTEVF